MDIFQEVMEKFEQEAFNVERIERVSRLVDMPQPNVQVFSMICRSRADAGLMVQTLLTRDDAPFSKLALPMAIRAEPDGRAIVVLEHRDQRRASSLDDEHAGLRFGLGMAIAAALKAIEEIRASGIVFAGGTPVNSLLATCRRPPAALPGPRPRCNASCACPTRQVIAAKEPRSAGLNCA